MSIVVVVAIKEEEINNSLANFQRYGQIRYRTASFFEIDLVREWG